MAFRIGERVVCVDDKFGPRQNPEINPVRGSVYTVRDVIGDGIRLVEIVNKRFLYWQGVDECAFKFRRFRPLIERKTSTGFEILDEIRKRESETTRAPRRATV